jgi:hypothetical protein
MKWLRSATMSTIVVLLTGVQATATPTGILKSGAIPSPL